MSNFTNQEIKIIANSINLLYKEDCQLDKTVDKTTIKNELERIFTASNKSPNDKLKDDLAFYEFSEENESEEEQHHMPWIDKLLENFLIGILQENIEQAKEDEGYEEEAGVLTIKLLKFLTDNSNIRSVISENYYQSYLNIIGELLNKKILNNQQTQNILIPINTNLLKDNNLDYTITYVRYLINNKNYDLATQLIAHSNTKFKIEDNTDRWGHKLNEDYENHFWHLVAKYDLGELLDYVLKNNEEYKKLNEYWETPERNYISQMIKYNSIKCFKVIEQNLDETQTQKVFGKIYIDAEKDRWRHKPTDWDKHCAYYADYINSFEEDKKLKEEKSKEIQYFKSLENLDLENLGEFFQDKDQQFIEAYFSYAIKFKNFQAAYKILDFYNFSQSEHIIYYQAPINFTKNSDQGQKIDGALFLYTLALENCEIEIIKMFLNNEASHKHLLDEYSKLKYNSKVKKTIDKSHDSLKKIRTLAEVIDFDKIEEFINVDVEPDIDPDIHAVQKLTNIIDSQLSASNLDLRQIITLTLNEALEKKLISPKILNELSGNNDKSKLSDLTNVAMEYFERNLKPQLVKNSLELRGQQSVKNKLIAIAAVTTILAIICALSPITSPAIILACTAKLTAVTGIEIRTKTCAIVASSVLGGISVISDLLALNTSSKIDQLYKMREKSNSKNMQVNDDNLKEFLLKFSAGRPENELNEFIQTLNFYASRGR